MASKVKRRKKLKNKGPRPGAWIEELFEAAKKQRFVHFETNEGTVRSGKITSLRTRDVMLNGQPQKLIEEFELNGDSMDCIPFVGLKRVVIE